MPSHRLVRKDHLVFIAVVSTLVITGPSISTYGYFDIPKAVYGQPAPDRTNSNTTNVVNTEDIPLEKNNDLKETLLLMQYANGARPYLDWYNERVQQ